MADEDMDGACSAVQRGGGYAANELVGMNKGSDVRAPKPPALACPLLAYAQRRLTRRQVQSVREPLAKRRRPRSTIVTLLERETICFSHA